MLESAQKLALGSPLLLSRLPAFWIDCLNYNNIRCKVIKYTKKDNTLHKSTIKENLSYLFNQF